MPEPITVESLGAVQGDAFRALLPADIQAKPYAKEINNFGDLVKKFDGGQVLLGQRATPDPTAPDDVWAAFHGKVRPEKPESYAIPEIEGVPPEFVKKAGESKMIRELLHAASASPYQAKVLLSGFLKQIYTADQATTKQRDDAFTKLTTELFGANKEAMITNGKKFLAPFLPDNVKPFLEGADEKTMAIILAATDGLAKKLSGEDPFRGGGGGGGGGGGETKDQLVLQMQGIMKEPCWSDPFKDQAKHKELEGKMNVIRDKLKKLGGSA